MHDLKGNRLSINRDALSYDALEIWELLDEKQQIKIQKRYPFRGDRNKAIIGLKRKGVKVRVLVEITDFSRVTILRITKGIKAGSVESRPKETIYNEIVTLSKDLKQELSEIKTIILSKYEEK